jgi:membrane dipeptidase
MRRRDFLSRSIKAAAGSVITAKGLKNAWAQNKVDFIRVAEERKSHPLYFDALTFFGGEKGGLQKSGLSGFVWDVSQGEIVDGKYIRQMKPSLKSIAKANKLLRDNTEGLFLATRGSQIKEANESGKIAVFLQFQSAESLSEDLDMVDVFYELGLRICQFTHHYGNAFAGGALVREFTGLTELGHKALARMNELNIIPDLSHGNEVLGLEVAKYSKKPVVITHTGCRTLVNNARCAPDSVIKGVADTGGVVGIFSMSFWLTENPVPTVDSYIRQLEHVIKVGGADAVGISNDYDVSGQLQAAALNNNNAEVVKGYFPWWKQHEGILGFDELPKHVIIPELNNVRRFFTIQAALEKKGYKADIIEKIMGGNWVRVLTDCLG